MPQARTVPVPPAAGTNPNDTDPRDAALSDEDIALLCDVGDSFPAKLNADEQRRLSRLIAAGYVECADPDKAPEKYQLTGKAEKILAERGVGLNEA